MSRKCADGTCYMVRKISSATFGLTRRLSTGSGVETYGDVVLRVARRAKGGYMVRAGPPGGLP